MNEYCVINIGRQLGSGGHEIGERLAELFGFSFYDKELIRLASMESGLCSEIFERADERVRYSVFDGLFGVTDNYLSNETLFQIQSDVIRKLANEGSCVFVGRCADYVLKDHPRAINLFITANLEDRVKRVMTQQHLSLAEARSHIERTDKRRATYYNFYSNKVWGAADYYDLCVNTSVLGIEETVNFLKIFIEKRFSLTAAN